MLKLELAAAIREAGWFAELEVPAADGSWRADVMATSVDGSQRMAWEASCPPITDDDIEYRMDGNHVHEVMGRRQEAAKEERKEQVRYEKPAREAHVRMEQRERGHGEGAP